MSAPNLPRLRSTLFAGLCLAILGGAFAAALATKDEPEIAARTIELVAANMVFEGAAGIIAVAPGETIEFVLVNRDPGMVHDLAIPDLSVSTGPVQAGSSRSFLVTFQDSAPARIRYLCTYHPVTMLGWIEVGTPAPMSEDLARSR